MWCVWEHVYRLYSFYTISDVQILQVSGLRGRVTADVDNALRRCPEDGLHDIGVHTGTWR